ncbi:hypothetical protein GGQ74_002353 [Desulfobaculum xiamenense]|uniref:Glycosyltransferase 2-like domain-containing protein n=1 Tax=Desulfobaculum xiamenense TaxID=995050 RepID=A0A846QNT8_9BACT|nr:glycosyltransferase family 2 protein [Desulfobaculum xiamenense]NJB68680.1 hypothetical protein [Desulfobaculum xiamenense]
MAEPLVSVVIPTHNRAGDLVECIESVLRSDYPAIEVVVADDCSTDDTQTVVRERFPDAVIARTPRNGGASLARNTGARASRGDLIFFLDSDATVAPDAIRRLVDEFVANDLCGLAGPVINFYDEPDVVWFAGADIDLVTGRTTYLASPASQDASYLTGHVPTAFMVRRGVFESTGGFDTRYFIIFEESDFAEAVTRAGYEVRVVPGALAWHKLSFADFSDADQRIQKAIGLRNAQRGYLVSRNRLLFMRKNATRAGYAAFLVLFMPLLTGYYVLQSLRFGRPDIAMATLRGVAHGLAGRFAEES